MDETPREGGILRVPMAADPGSFNPLLTGPDHLPEPWRRIYPVLLIAEPRGAAAPLVQGDLARAWTWSPEQRTLTCTLRQGWFWEDTLRVTVADVVRTYEAYRAAGWLTRRAPGDSLPDVGLLTVSAIDDSTVRLSYGPGISFWHALPAAAWPVLPARKLSDLGLAMLQANPLGHEPLSAESFRITDWRHGLNLWLAPNPMALGRRKPLLERVEMDICPGLDSRILRLQLGSADVVTEAPPHLLDALLEGDTLPQLHHDGIDAVEMLCWNTRLPAFSASLRRAVSLALDRDRITRELLTWKGIACGGPAAGLLEPLGPAEGAEGAGEAQDAAAVTVVPAALSAGPAVVDSVATPGGLPAAIVDSVSAPDSLRATKVDSVTAPDFLPEERGDSAVAPGALPAAMADSVITPTGPDTRDILPRFDPGEANRLLDLAGWSERGPDGIRARGGVPLRIAMIYQRDDEFRERLATLIESDLARVGIDLAAEPVARHVLWGRFHAGLFETALLGFRPPVVPDVSELWASWGYWNGSRYANFRVDSLCTALRQEESPRTVERLARRIESIVRRDGPATFLVYREWTALLSPRVRAFRGTAADPLRGLEGVWVADSAGTQP